ERAPQEYTCKERRPVTAPSPLRSPHHPTGKQENHRLEDGRFPVERSNLPGAPAFDVVDSRQDQAEQRNGRPESPLRAYRAMHHGNQEENQGRGLPQDAREIQPRKLANEQR